MILAKPNTSGSISVPAVIISFFTLIFPFVNIMHDFFPLDFLGKNLWLLTTMLAILTLYLSTLFRAKKPDIVFLVIAIVGGCIFLLREHFYTEQRSFLDFRYMLSSFIFLLLFKRFVNGEKNINLLSWVLIATCFIQAVTGILHAHWFSEFNISFNPDDRHAEFISDAERTREGGTLGASIYANVVVCGMFLLVANYSKRESFSSNVLLIISISIMLYAVFLSGSRYPIIVACLLALVFFSRVLSNLKRMTALLGIIIAIAFVVVINNENVEFLGILRFNEDNSGRLVKMLLPLLLLSENLLHFLIGAPTAVIASTFSAEGISISDNSYMLMAVQFGFVFAAGYFVFLIALLRHNVIDKPSLLFMIYVLIGLGMTNSILWEPWLFIAWLVSSIMYHGAPAYLAKMPRPQSKLII